MMRRGYTLIEMMVAAAVGIGCLSIMITLFTMTRRMSNAGELSAALSEAAMAMEILHRDLSQAVQKPDPAVGRVVFPLKSGDGFRFIRGERRDGVLAGTLVTYEREKLPSGRLRLVRRIDSRTTHLPGTYSAIRVKEARPTGGPFLRVTLHVLAREIPAGAPVSPSDEAVLTSLVRVAGPEMVQSPLLEFKFMEELKKVELPE
jgi:type II secretory pathway pseudopilin PulG